MMYSAISATIKKEVSQHFQHYKKRRDFGTFGSLKKREGYPQISHALKKGTK